MQNSPLWPSNAMSFMANGTTDCYPGRSGTSKFYCSSYFCLTPNANFGPSVSLMEIKVSMPCVSSTCSRWDCCSSGGRCGSRIHRRRWWPGTRQRTPDWPEACFPENSWVIRLWRFGKAHPGNGAARDTARRHGQQIESHHPSSCG